MGLHSPNARRFLLLFCALLLHSPLAYGSPSDYSADYIFQVWQTDQGLPENSATAMVQTPDGYLWFGTFNGLVRFDGVKFTVFDRSNTPDLLSPGIVNLYLDRSDRLWVSTLLGTAYVRDGRWRVFHQQDGWAGDYVWRFAETSSGDIYLTTFDHKILRFDGDRFHEIAPPPVANPELGFQLYVDGTDGLCVINPQFIGKFAQGKWQELIPAASLLGKYRFLARADLMAGGSRDGGLWIVTADYLRKYHSERLMFETRVPWTLRGLWSLYEDSSGGVWITSSSDGLYHFSAEQGWQHFTTDSAPIFEDRQETIWVGTQDGVFAYDGTQFRKYFFSPRPEHSNASSLAEDAARKILWVGNHDVNGIVDEMITLLKGEAARCSVVVRTELAAASPKIIADHVQLQQVFMNLMLNAIEAMQDWGGELTVNSQLQDGKLLFSISDTGVGLPAGDVEQIFSAFFTTKSEGSGMGLAISRSIVESHGGRLWATVNDGRGAIFHFTLPTHVTESALAI